MTDDVRRYARATEEDCLAELRQLHAAWAAGPRDDFSALDGPALARVDLGRDPLVLLGASNEFATMFIAHAVPRYRVLAVCDNTKIGETIAGATVQADSVVAELRGQYPDLAAINLTWGRAGTRYFEGLAKRHGIPCLPLMLAFRRAGIPSAYTLIDGRTQATLAAFEELVGGAALYDDAFSRETLYRLLLSRLTHERRWLNRVNINYHTMYFGHGLFELADDERFADVGAYTGDSIDTFCWHVGNTYARIDAFEPNPEVHERLAATAGKRANVHVHKVAVGDEPGKSGLRSAGLAFGKEIASFVDATGPMAIEIRRLDDELPEGSSFIKMDIEGFEAAALRGAVKTIQRDRPNLAICAYHHNGDVLELARLIKEIEPGYRLYLRHHADFEWDTVIYGVCE